MKAIDAHLRRVPALLHVVVALAAGLAGEAGPGHPNDGSDPDLAGTCVLASTRTADGDETPFDVHRMSQKSLELDCHVSWLRLRAAWTSGELTAIDISLDTRAA